MKKKLNLLCIIVMLVLSYPLLETCYYFYAGLKAGVEAGYGACSDVTEEERIVRMMEAQKAAHICPVSVMPSDLSFNGLLQDSVFNARTGEYVSACHTGLMVSVDTKNGLLQSCISFLLSLVTLSMCIWAIVLFVKLILAINKYDIFSWKNVRRLRRLGLALVICFGSEVLTVYLSYRSLARVFALEGYDFCLTDNIRITTLVLGLCALIAGEIFAIGLKMKEEQELTI